MTTAGKRGTPARPAARACAEALDLGVPMALCQLPQVTENELNPARVESLARTSANFLLFKDTSGRDVVAESGRNLGGVFLMRGAEGGYVSWLRSTGGHDDGFRLSTANAFAPHYARLLLELGRERKEEAEAHSARIEAVVNRVFAKASAVKEGYPFTNANKAIDHGLAWGADGGSRAARRLISGHRLPSTSLDTAKFALGAADLLPVAGYLSPWTQR